MLKFAVRKDRNGWRSIQSTEELLPDEDLEETDGSYPVTGAPPREELVAAANRELEARLATAANRVAPLQDAYDAGSATDAEAEALQLWKAYRIALSRIETQEGYPEQITWPDPPSISDTP